MRQLVTIVILAIQMCSLAQQPTASVQATYTTVSVHGSILLEGAEGASPVVGASVKLLSKGRVIRETFTDNGEFYLYKVAPGDYDIVVRVRDAKYRYGVTVANGAPFSEIPPITLEEWVYYGNRYAPNQQAWEELLFHRATGDDLDFPQVGDIVVATKDVDVRQGLTIVMKLANFSFKIRPAGQ